MQYIRVESVSRRESDGETIIRAIFEITPQEYGRIIEERNERNVAQANEERRQRIERECEQEAEQARTERIREYGRVAREQIERENEADRERERQWYQTDWMEPPVSNEDGENFS